MEVRALRSGDLPGIRAITLATGRSEEESGADPGYVELLRLSGRALVAVDGDSVLGWAAVVPTPCGVLLSDLFVDPVVHARGVGTALLRRLRPAPQFAFSSMHPAALPLYVRAGLVPSWPLLYVSGPVDRLPRGALHVDPVDAGTAAAVEAELTGARARTAVYRYWTRRPGAVALVVRDGSRPVAVGAGRPGVPGVLSHLTCPDAGSAAGALYAAVAALGGDHVAFCVPGPHPAVRLLLASGFRVDALDVTMRPPHAQVPAGWIYASGLG